MAIIKDFVLKSGLIANTVVVVNGVNVLANDYATYLAALSNDYSTYTTLNERINNVADNVGGGASGYQANDYNTYTTLVGEYRANDYNTYTTLVGEYQANDYATLLAAQSNDGATLLSARANDYATYTALDANTYNTYLAALSNDGATLLAAYANDVVTLDAALANDGVTLGLALANDYTTYLAAMSNDGATLLAAYANDIVTLDAALANDGVTLEAAYANDGVALGLALANDYSTLLAAQSNDYSTLLAAQSNDYTTLLAAYSNDYATYTTLQAHIDNVQSNVTSGGDASNTWVNANDYATYLAALSNDYSTYTTLVNEYQGNDYSTYTALVGEYQANDYNTYTGLLAYVDIKANSSVEIVVGDGLVGGGPLSGNVNVSVDASVVRTTGNQTLNNSFVFSDNVVIMGGLVVNGNVTVVSTTNMTVDDRFIELGANTSGLPSADSGIYFNRGASGNSAFYYDESEGYFTVAHTLDPATNVTVHPTAYAWFKTDTLLVSNSDIVVNLNADKLDDQEGAYYLDFLNLANTNAITLAYVTANGAVTSDDVQIGGLNSANGTLFVDRANSRVGILTEQPQTMLQIKDGGFSTSNLYTTATTANQVLDSFSASAFRTAKYLVQVHDTANNDYQSSEILLLHDGVDPYITEYAIVFTAGSLATFNADINGGNARLLVTPTNNTNEIKVIRTNLIA